MKNSLNKLVFFLILICLAGCTSVLMKPRFESRASILNWLEEQNQGLVGDSLDSNPKYWTVSWWQSLQLELKLPMTRRFVKTCENGQGGVPRICVEDILEEFWNNRQARIPPATRTAIMCQHNVIEQIKVPENLLVNKSFLQQISAIQTQIDQQTRAQPCSAALRVDVVGDNLATPLALNGGISLAELLINTEMEKRAIVVQQPGLIRLHIRQKELGDQACRGAECIGNPEKKMPQQLSDVVLWLDTIFGPEFRKYAVGASKQKFVNFALSLQVRNLLRLRALDSKLMRNCAVAQPEDCSEKILARYWSQNHASE